MSTRTSILSRSVKANPDVLAGSKTQLGFPGGSSMVYVRVCFETARRSINSAGT
jgi:hypothetical protein